MDIQQFENTHGKITITQLINDDGDYCLQVKLHKPVIEQIQQAQSKDNCYISVEDSLFQTALSNLMLWYLHTKTNLVRLAQANTILHRIVCRVCSDTFNEAVEECAKTADKKERIKSDSASEVH